MNMWSGWGLEALRLRVGQGSVKRYARRAAGKDVVSYTDAACRSSREGSAGEHGRVAVATIVNTKRQGRGSHLVVRYVSD